MVDVINTLQLPDQPSPAGVVQYVALGGNGFSAPRGMYTIRNFASTGDALGGEHTHNIIMDPDYCSVIAYATMQIDVSAGNRAIHWQIASTAVPLQAENTVVRPVSSGLAGSQIVHTWMPPAFINPGSASEVPTLVCSVVNVEDEILNLNVVVLTFDIRARESALYDRLIGSRGGMYTGPIAN